MLRELPTKGDLEISSTRWWQDAVIYQIYPQSFCDTNGDGIGDLAGIVAKIPYLRSLGIDAVWLSPIFVSPMVDGGYDIADYQHINPIYGNMQDFKELVTKLPAAGIRLLLDLVPNHTSDQHEWFRESRKSRDNHYREWYIWRDGRAGGPPNNWESYFGGSAWTYDAITQQYYLHSYALQQPDLNWRSPAVRRAMGRVMQYWLKRGVDGFRVDVLWQVSKDEQFRDNPCNSGFRNGMPFWLRQRRLYSENRPEAHEVARWMRRIVDGYTQDGVLLAEVVLPTAAAVSYYGNGDEMHLVHNFALTEFSDWTATKLAQVIANYYQQLPGGAWPTWILGDHDFSRVASRLGSRQARLAQLLLLTLRGTPTCYQGDELGMLDGEVILAGSRDPQAAGTPERNREAARTPMPWKESLRTEFSRGQPWSSTGVGAGVIGVELQEHDEASNLNLFRALMRLRHQHVALRRGQLRIRMEELPAILSYERNQGDEQLRIRLNFTDKEVAIKLDGDEILWISTEPNCPTNLVVSERLVLRPQEGILTQAVVK